MKPVKSFPQTEPKRPGANSRSGRGRQVRPHPAARKSRRDSSLVRVGLIQASRAPEPDQNLRKTLRLAEEAAKNGAQLICTQELFRSQYFCQTEDYAHFQLAEPIPGPSTEAFQKLARRHEVVVIASLFEKRAPG